MSFHSEIPHTNNRNIVMRISPSTRLNMICCPKTGFTLFSSVVASSGMYLYMKMKKAIEKAMFRPAIQPVISNFFPGSLPGSLLGCLIQIGVLSVTSHADDFCIHRSLPSETHVSAHNFRGAKKLLRQRLIDDNNLTASRSILRSENPTTYERHAHYAKVSVINRVEPDWSSSGF